MPRFFILLLVLAACFGPLEPGTELAPPCAAPAPLEGVYNASARGYTVMFREGVPTARETQRLARRYEFSPTFVWDFIGAFAADLHPWVVAQLRCERSVLLVEYNGIAGANATVALIVSTLHNDAW